MFTMKGVMNPFTNSWVGRGLQSGQPSPQPPAGRPPAGQPALANIGRANIEKANVGLASPC
jgi:hypothetical protein